MAEGTAEQIAGQEAGISLMVDGFSKYRENSVEYVPGVLLHPHSENEDVILMAIVDKFLEGEELLEMEDVEA